MKTVRIIIEGRVQGVGFRLFLRQKAQLLNIKGYAENAPNGAVEVIAQSDNEKDLSQFIKECWRGPILARINNVKVSEISMDRNYDFFDVR